MRKALLLAAILLCLCLPVWSEAQSCDGCGIGYRSASLGSGGGTLTGPLLLPNGTAAAPSLAFAAEPGLGFSRLSAAFIGLQYSSAPRIGFYASQPWIMLNNAGALVWVSNNNVGTGTADLFLFRDAANTLALRNGTAAQTFNIYNTYTDASNYERGTILWTANQFKIDTQAAGTGVTTRSLVLSSGNDVSFTPTSGNAYFYSNAVLTPTDSRDIGSSAILARSLYLTRSIQGSKTRALTAATPTAAWDCAIAAGARTGGTIDYCVYGADATDYQYRCGAIKFSAVNKAGTTTCTMSPAAPDQTNDGNAGAITSSTLTYAITCTDTTDSFALLFNAASGLAETTLQVESRLNLMNPATCTPQ